MPKTHGAVSCDLGWNAVGGGSSGGDELTQHINTSRPMDTNGWEVWMNNTGTAGTLFRVYVICVEASSITPPRA